LQSFLEFVILIVVSTGSLYLKGGDSNGAKSKQPFHYYYTIIRNYYVGHKWSGVCTYDNWFGNYNGVATAYYIHTYNEANLKSVTFGKNGTTAGIEANIEAVESSFTAFSNDTVFGTYP